MKKNTNFNQIALIAPTASGKTELSIKLAHKYNAIILSLDSLAVYKYIDIASAKPTLYERDGIRHFGIDIVEPNEKFDVILFIDEYKKAKEYAKIHNKNLIIVGGSSFYLKSMIDGLSQMPIITTDISHKVCDAMSKLEESYKFLFNTDKEYMKNIQVNDKYRIKKALEVYFATNTIPSIYFKENIKKPIITNIQIFQIDTDVNILRNRIFKRTKKMIKNGLIDEVLLLEKKYERSANSMQSIGIKETLDYIDNKITKSSLEELISIHTAQLAKRQRTFNKSQFSNITQSNLRDLEYLIKF